MDLCDHPHPQQKVLGSNNSDIAFRNNRRDCWANQMMKNSLAVLVFLSAAAAQHMTAMAARPDVMKDSGFCSEIIEPYILYNCTEYTVWSRSRSHVDVFSHSILLYYYSRSDDLISG